jgi:hypothetical protein
VTGPSGTRPTSLTGALPALLVAALLGLVACSGSEATAGPNGPSPPPSPATPGARPAATPAPSHRPVVTPGWVGPFYPPHAHGYDLSYPQCSAILPPAAATFSIVGVDDGRTFTVNPCLQAEWRAATGLRAVYFNSGYDPANAARTTGDCRSRAQYQDGGADRRTAYAIGCSEAVYAVNAMRTAGADRAVMIWIDVETSNSWDPAGLDLNRTALQAEVDELAAFGHLVGLYATFDEWRSIVGDWSPAGIVADWVAGETPQVNCGLPGFSGHPVWVAQELATWSGYDSDWTC